MIEVTEIEKCTVKPLEDRILVKPLEGHHESKISLTLPQGTQKKPTLGIVIAVGPPSVRHILDLVKNKAEIMTVDAQVKPGDKVLFTKYAGFDIKINGIGHLVVFHRDLIAVVEDEKE